MTHQPRRAAATVLGATVAAATLAACVPTTPTSQRSGSGEATGPVGIGRSASAAAMVRSAAADDDGVGNTANAPPAAAARAVVERFARAWARPDLDPATWYAGVAAHTAPTYARMLATVDPANIPATTITGPATAEASTTAMAVFSVPTDAGPLRITCNDVGGRWLVTHVDRPTRGPVARSGR